MTVAQLLASADSRELQEWSVYLEADALRHKDEAERRRIQRELDTP